MTRRVQDELASREIGRDFVNGISINSSTAVNNHNVPMTQRDKSKNGHNDCNSQICSSYVVGLLACLLIIGGVFLAFQRWDYMWLVVTLVGIVLTFVGASLHYCGTQENSRHHGGNSIDGSVRREASQSERLLSPSAPSLGTFSTSQLSLSMLPPYFPSYDAVSLSNGGPPILSNSSVGSGGISPIMQINGQSFLLLPIGGRIDEETNAQSQIFANKIANASTLQLNREPNENTNEQQRGLIMIKPRDLQTAPISVVNQTRSNNETTVTSSEPSSPSVSQSTQTCTVEIQTVPEVPSTSAVIPRTVSTNAVETNSEPIYEVPRLISEEVTSERVTENVDVAAADTGTSTDTGTIGTVVECTETPIITELAIPIVIDLEVGSRATSPDRDEFADEDISSPPSYDEVATVATTRRLGMPKFAYETM